MAVTKAQSQEKFFEECSEADQCSDVNECPMAAAIDVIGGKWTVLILYNLRGQTLRFGELKRKIPKITQKMLAHQLRGLEANKLVTRKVYAEVPPRVEYTPTELASALNPALDLLCNWGKRYQEKHRG